MHIHYFQHDDYEDLGCIAFWATENGHRLSCTRFDRGELPPSADAFDALIVMGGHMGACDDAQFPWLTAEKLVIADAIRKNKIVIGICLGSQLVASALGAKVYKNKFPEIGVYPLILTPDAAGDPIFRHLASVLEVLHWHFDTFDLPEGAVLMASSAATTNQAFRYGRHVIALQFHFEQDEISLDRFIAEGRYELKHGKWIQEEAEIQQYKNHCRNNNAIFSLMLNALLEDGTQIP